MIDEGVTITSKGGWLRLGVIALALTVSTPLVAALLGPFGDDPPGKLVAESLGFLALFGWWLYLPGTVVYALALPAMVRRATAASPRVVALLASPLILAVPLVALIALLAFGGVGATEAEPGDSIGFGGLLAVFVIPSLMAAAVVPLPTRPTTPSPPRR